MYDFRPLVDESVKLREDQQLLEQGRDVAYDFNTESQPVENVPVLHREEWPDPNLLKLDPTQFEALHRALTKEFSVIQVIMVVMMMIGGGSGNDDDDDDDDERPGLKLLRLDPSQF